MCEQSQGENGSQARPLIKREALENRFKQEYGTARTKSIENGIYDFSKNCGSVFEVFRVSLWLML